MEGKYVLLPADDAVQNWFEENIDKECSASSAVYKFRLWLESLQVTRQGEGEPMTDSVRYELRLALYDMIRVTRALIENRGTILSARKRIEAAEGILNKHFKITDVLRGVSPASASQDAHEKEIMMQAFDKVRQIFEGRQWIMDGRGSYPYNDDRYKEEVRYMYNEFDQVVKDTWANIKSKSADYKKAVIAEYLESPAARREEDDPQELWDEHSALIGDDIDDLSFWAGREVMKKEDFFKALKQQKGNP